MKRLILLIASSTALLGCLDDECRQMQKCCAAVQGVAWVGSSCGELASGVRDPGTCHTITETIRHTFAERGEEPPEACGATP